MKYMALFQAVILVFLVVFASDSGAETYIVEKVTEDCRLQQKNGQNSLKLAGIIIPEENKKEACALIDKIIAPKNEVTAKTGYKWLDRHGYILAQIYNKKDFWVQGELLKNGLALAYPTPDNDIAAEEMFKAEKLAINAKKGYWKNNNIYQAISLKNNYKQHVSQFLVVVGTVYEVNMRRDKVYINFEKDWKNDFSLLINKDNFRAFKKMQLTDLKGKKIMVRGWLEDYNGPMIEVRSPLEIRIF